MLAAVTFPLMAGIPDIGSDANWGKILAVFEWNYALLSPFGVYLADRFSRQRSVATYSGRMMGTLIGVPASGSVCYGAVRSGKQAFTVSAIPAFGLGLKADGSFRSDVCLGRARARCPACLHRLDEPTRLSLRPDMTRFQFIWRCYRSSQFHAAC